MNIIISHNIEHHYYHNPNQLNRNRDKTSRISPVMRKKQYGSVCNILRSTSSTSSSVTSSNEMSVSSRDTDGATSFHSNAGRLCLVRLAFSSAVGTSAKQIKRM